MRLRKDLQLYANLRPAVTYPALADASSLKRELVEGLDIMILRELTGGVYFGEPKTITDLGNGQKRAVDTQVYDTYEIERIARVAFELARKRRNKVTSMEKRNVMKTGVLWNEVVGQVHAREFKDVQLEHVLADAGGMQLVRNPKQFDVIVTDNLFGDMLSDVAAMLTGSLGMLASASLGETDPKTKKRKALYEPVHGSAPDIAGKGVANPIAMIASFAMALRYSFGMIREADMIEQAIAAALAKGLRTADIASAGMTTVGTAADGRCDHCRDGAAGGLSEHSRCRRHLIGRHTIRYSTLGRRAPTARNPGENASMARSRKGTHNAVRSGSMPERPGRDGKRGHITWSASARVSAARWLRRQAAPNGNPSVRPMWAAG